MPIEVVIFIIPIVAILSKTVKDITRMILEHQRQGVRHEDKGDVLAMQRRMAEMEQRILTLQDLVIGGDYEVRRRMERAQAEMTPASSSGEAASYRTLASMDHD